MKRGKANKLGKYREIEILREKLNKKVESNDDLTIDEETLHISKELDVLINEYYNKIKLKKNKKN